MTTRVGTGLSRAAEGAGAEAAREAVEALGGATASYGFVFASPRHELTTTLAAVAEVSGCQDLLGCTSAGEINQSALVHGGVSVMLVHASDAMHQLALAGGMREKHPEVAKRLYQGFSEKAAEAKARGWAHSTSVVAVDGLAETCERLVKRIIAESGPFQQVVGGAAGIEAAFPKFTQAQVGVGREAKPDAAAALHVFGPARWGVGMEHGLVPPGAKISSLAKMTVTRVAGNVIEQLDGKPAVEAYRSHARDHGMTLTPDIMWRYFLTNPLGLCLLDELRAVRVPAGATEGGGLICTAELAQGSTVAILHSEVENLVQAAGRAASAALKNLDGARPAGVLIFDCGTRGTALGDQFEREIWAVQSVFPGVPMAGLLTYGEIARFRGRLEPWHHSSAVVVAIPQ